MALAKALLARLLSNNDEAQRAEMEQLIDATELPPDMEQALQLVVGADQLQRMEDDNLLAALGFNRDDIER